MEGNQVLLLSKICVKNPFKLKLFSTSSCQESLQFNLGAVNLRGLVNMMQRVNTQSYKQEVFSVIDSLMRKSK